MPIYNMVRSSDDFVPPTWAGGTPSEIAKALDRHYAGKIDLADYWNVGDERQIRLASMLYPDPEGDDEYFVLPQTLTIVLVNVGGKTLETPINGHTECAFVWQTKELLSDIEDEYYIGLPLSSGNNNNASWRDTYARTWLSTHCFPALPAWLQNVTKSVENKTLTSGTSYSTTITTYDKIALPSLVEVNGSVNNMNTYGTYYALEGTAWTYYDTSANKLKYNIGAGGITSAARIWWTRTPRAGNTSYYVSMPNTATGYAASSSPMSYTPVAPFGCI